MSFSQLMLVLKARKITLLIVFLAILLTTVVVSLLLPKQYTATASVLVDVKSPDPISGMVLQGMMMPTYMATQVDIVSSARVAQRAIRELRLSETPALREQWQNETKGQGDFESWLISLIQKQLEVSPSRESNVITISYTAADPRFAAAMANAFTSSYITTSVELRAEPARQFSEMFEGQAEELRKRLDQAQARLSKYQQEKGIIATDERLDVENQRLQELTAQLVAVQSMAADSSSRQAQAGDASPEVIANSVVSTLKADLARQEAKSKEISARLGSAHPQVVEIEASIKELKARIAQEVAKIGSSLTVNSRVNQMRESQIRAAVEAQRNKILQMKEQRDAVAGKLRDIESAQRAYDQVIARFNQTSLESQSNQTNVALLKRATPPSSHTSPSLIINTLVAIVVGGILSLGVAIFLELIDRRVRGEEDILNIEGLTVLGEVPRMNADTNVANGRVTNFIKDSKLVALGYKKA